jgi:SH3-like domain-containing protein
MRQKMVKPMRRHAGAFRGNRAIFLNVIGGLLAVTLATAAHAAEDRGPVTNLPLPRFVSLKTDEGNVRRGPSLTHRIDWVFTRRNMPLEVTAEYGNWRKVRDREGAGGWVHYALLSGVRTALVEEDMTALRSKPDDTAPINARAETGVVARLGECSADWCWVTADGQRGWVRKAALWGVKRDEILD